MMACNGRMRKTEPDYAAFFKAATMTRSITTVAVFARVALAAIVALGLFTQARAADDGAFDQGLLWRIEKAGAPASHLFGTIHLADPRVTALPDPVRQRFDAAKSFAMEVQLDQSNLLMLAARMVYTDGRDLPGVAGEALFRQVAPELEKIGLPAELARAFKPWAVMMLLEMPAQESTDVLDMKLYRAATAQGKSLHYLETVDEQIDSLDGMSDVDQVALMRHAFEARKDLSRETERMLQAYLQRDLAELWRIGEEDVAAQPELKPLQAAFVRRLLVERNLRMVGRMQPLLAAGNTFVAVGALHLYGEQGILNLLIRAGYRVSRIY